MKKQKNGNHLFNVFTYLLKNISTKIKAGSLKKLSDYIFIILEKITLKFPSFLYEYILYYEDIVESEIRLADITSGDKVLHIGCGSLPSTAILLSQKIGIQTTALEKNPSSVKDAKFTVKTLHQEYQVKINQANALNYPIESYSVIVVSQGIEPRYEVLNHIAKTMQTGTRVLFRTFSSNTGGITSQDTILNTIFNVGKTVLHPQHGLLMTILLKTKTK